MTDLPIWDGSADNVEAFLAPTYYIDSDAPAIRAFAEKATQGCETDREKAIALFNTVRDHFRYDPYTMPTDRQTYRASYIVEGDSGYCITKSIVLAAAARASGIPAAIGFADVQNHLNSPRLQELMGTDLFAYHGFAVLFVEGKWIKLGSGTLIHPRVMLTAGHLTHWFATVWNAQPGDLRVSFDPYALDEETWLEVERYITHPDYNDYQGSGGSANPGMWA